MKRSARNGAGNVFDQLALKVREVARQEDVNSGSGVERFKVNQVFPLLQVEHVDGELVLEEGDPDFTIGAWLNQRRANYGLNVGDQVWCLRADQEWHAVDVTDVASRFSMDSDPPPAPAPAVLIPVFVNSSRALAAGTLARVGVGGLTLTLPSSSAIPAPANGTVIVVETELQTQQLTTVDSGTFGAINRGSVTSRLMAMAGGTSMTLVYDAAHQLWAAYGTSVPTIPCGKVIRQTAGLQAIAAGVGAEIMWDTTKFTKNGMAAAPSGGGFVVPLTGVYDVGVQVLMNADSAGTAPRLDLVLSNITVNGPLASSGWDAGHIVLWQFNNFQSINLRSQIQCSAGDRVNAGVFNRDSIVHNIYGAGAGNPWTQMSITMVTNN